MQKTQFDGQQEGERILAQLRPNIIPTVAAICLSIVLIIFFMAVLYSISNVMVVIAFIIKISAVVIGIIAVLFSGWSIYATQMKTVTYITDRRIIRFEMLSPVYTAKRSLFWSEVLKAKAFSTNLILRILKVGSIQIEPQAAEHEAIKITNVEYFEDLANYIDKILYLYKNNPNELIGIKPFIFAPKGRRNSS
jgi:hypothetical protein